jgi:hypothetical protein
VRNEGQPVAKALLRRRLSGVHKSFFAWLVVVPFGIIVLALFIAALPIKRKVTPEQFADELERHLLGTEGKWDWDDLRPLQLLIDRLELIRWALPEFDCLSDERDREELRGLMAALRRGEVPEVAPRDLTYRLRPNHRK